MLLELIYGPELSNDYNMATYLMISFCNFLQNQTIENLDSFYSDGRGVIIPKPPTLLTRFNIQIKKFIQNHSVISQLLFTTFLLFVTYVIGMVIKANIQNIVGWMFPVIIGSFTLFDKITKWIS